jgi:nucleoid DNA-binding protein
MSETVIRTDNTGMEFPGQKRSTKNRVGSGLLPKRMVEVSQNSYFEYEFKDFLEILTKTIWKELEEGRGVIIPNLVSFALRENLPHQWKNPITKQYQMTSYNLSVKAKASPALLRHLKKIPMKKLRKQNVESV